MATSQGTFISLSRIWAEPAIYNRDMILSAHDRASRIKVILFDVDGVLTDGTIWLVPAPIRDQSAVPGHHNYPGADGGVGFGIQSASMMEAKGYSAHDGAGISLARIAGLKAGVHPKRIKTELATPA